MSRSDAIEISWSNRKLEKACVDDSQGGKHWGADQWKLLKRRLVALRAAPTLGDMDGVPGNCHALHADRAGDFAVHLWGAFRLIFEPDHDPIPTLESGGLDRTKVTHIRIKEVTDYHGN